MNKLSSKLTLLLLLNAAVVVISCGIITAVALALKPTPVIFYTFFAFFMIFILIISVTIWVLYLKFFFILYIMSSSVFITNILLYMLRILEFIVRRIAEYPKGPVLALSALGAAIGGVLKAFV